jgi:hypothetical protein
MMVTQQTALFAIDDEPYLLWDEDVRARALEFLDSIDSDYFDFLATLGEAHMGDAQQGKRAAAACRIGFFQGAETLFLLIAALLQAPHSPQAFVGQCKTDQLRRIIRKITTCDTIELIAPRLKVLSWPTVARLVHARASSDEGQVAKLAEGFGAFWQRLAEECTDSSHVAEYNGLKHGFRVGYGGIRLDLGPALTDIDSIPADAEWTSLGGSDTGSSFYKVHNAGGDARSNRSRMCSRVFVNWSLHTMVIALQLISCSINNVLSALRLVNGATAGSQPFKYPTDLSAFERTWAESPSLRNFSFDAQLEAGRFRTKEQLLHEWRERIAGRAA